MDDIVEWASSRFMEVVAGQFLGGPVHEHAVLALIHEKYGHGRVAQYPVESPGCISQLGLDSPVLRDVLDRSVENRVIAIIKQLKLYRDIVFRSVLSLVNGIEIEPFDLTVLKRTDQIQKLIPAYIWFQVPRSQTGKFVDTVTEIVARTFVYKTKPEIIRRKYVNFARGFFDDTPETFAGHTNRVSHALENLVAASSVSVNS